MQLRAIEQKNKIDIRPKSNRQVQIECTLRVKRTIIGITRNYWASYWIKYFIQLCTHAILFQWNTWSSSFSPGIGIRLNIPQFQMTEWHDSDHINFQLNVQKSRTEKMLEIPVSFYIKSF